MVHGYLGETCSGMLREHWDADSSWLFWGGIMREGAGADVAQNSLIQCQWLACAERTWVVKWNFVIDRMWGKPNQLWLHLPCRKGGKGCSGSPGSVSSSRSWPLCPGCRSGCNCWLFSAYPNFSQLRALGVIYFTPVCKDFTWAFPFHHFQLWFGVGFFCLVLSFCLSILFCAGWNSQLDTEAVKL